MIIFFYLLLCGISLQSMESNSINWFKHPDMKDVFPLIAKKFDLFELRKHLISKASFDTHLTLKDTKAVHSLTFDSTGNYLASGTDNVKLWDLNTSTIKQTLPEYPNWINALHFNHDDTLLAIACNTISFYDFSSNKSIKDFPAYHDSTVTALSFSSDGKYLASGSYKTIKLLDLSTYQCIKTFETENFILSLNFSSDSKKLTCISSEFTILTIHTSTFETEKLTNHNHIPIESFIFNHKYNYFIYYVFGGNVCLSELENINNIDFLTSCHASISAKKAHTMTLSNDYNYLATSKYTNIKIKKLFKINRIYDYLNNPEIFNTFLKRTQFLLLYSLNNAILNKTKISLDTEQQAIFDKLPQFIQDAVVDFIDIEN